MNKLYWIVCEEGDQTLFEGRYLGRTRGAAMKHLKEQLGRSNLTGLVFSVTEIPVPLIRELVSEILNEREAAAAPMEDLPQIEPEPEPTPFQETAPRPEYDWEAIKACYLQGRGPTDVAHRMGVPLNTLKGRIKRERWAQQRRGE